MRLNIGNLEACRLARAIADATGETLTNAVMQALRERYALIESRKGRASVDEILAIADRVAVHIKRPNPIHGEILYDADGLPK